MSDRDLPGGGRFMFPGWSPPLYRFAWWKFLSDLKAHMQAALKHDRCSAALDGNVACYGCAHWHPRLVRVNLTLG